MWLDGSLISARKIQAMPRKRFTANAISGCGGSALGCEHNGDIARVRIYRSRLTDDELRTLFFTPVTTDDGVNSDYRWELIEGAGPVVGDSGTLSANLNGQVAGYAAWRSEAMKLRTLAATQGYTTFTTRGVFKLGEINIGDAFAMELVFRHADLQQANYVRMFALERSEDDNSHLAFIRHPERPGDVFFEVKTPTNDGTSGYNYQGVIQPRGPTDTEWHHLLVSKPADPSAPTTFYMDGNIVAETALGSHVKGTYTFNAIGGRANLNNGYAGDIALARIYSTAVSQAEAVELFQTALHRATEDNKFGVVLDPPAAWDKLAHSFEFNDDSFANGVEDVVGNVATSVAGENQFIRRTGILPSCPASRRVVAWAKTTRSRYADSLGHLMLTFTGEAGEVTVPMFREPRALDEFSMDMACLPSSVGRFVSVTIANPTDDGWEVASFLLEIADR